MSLHRIVVPALAAPLPVQRMFTAQLDVVEQMLTRFAEYGPLDRVDVFDVASRLTYESTLRSLYSQHGGSFFKTEAPEFVRHLGIVSELFTAHAMVQGPLRRIVDLPTPATRLATFARAHVRVCGCVCVHVPVTMRHVRRLEGYPSRRICRLEGYPSRRICN